MNTMKPEAKKASTTSATMTKTLAKVAKKAPTKGATKTQPKATAASAPKGAVKTMIKVAAKTRRKAAAAKKGKTQGAPKTQPKASSTAGTLAVTGEAEIKVRPDIALLDVNVVTTAKTAQEAVQRNADKMTSVIAALEQMGLDRTELQTVGYDVIPVFDNEEKSLTFGKILEYRVVSQLRVRVDVEEAGEVIDAAIAAGANMTSGVRYSVRDESTVRARALTAAVRAARRDATTVADALGIKLRDSQTVEINMGGMPVFFREMALVKTSTPIEPGTVDVRASVRVVYRTT